MGPFLFLYVALVGFFAFAALYHLILWWSSRRDTLLAIFTVDCGVPHCISGALAAVATATTVEEADDAIRARIALGMLMMLTWLWSLSKVSGVRASWFIWPITALLLILMPVHAFVVPFNAAVISVERSVMPWGETISKPQQGPQGWWVGPLYAGAPPLPSPDLACGLRYSAVGFETDGGRVRCRDCQQDAAAFCRLEVLRSYGLVSAPFIGVIPAENLLGVCDCLSIA